MLNAGYKWKKPIGFHWFKHEESHKYCESGFPYVILRNEVLGLSAKGTFSENFDMDALINDYKQYLEVFIIVLCRSVYNYSKLRRVSR